MFKNTIAILATLLMTTSAFARGSHDITKINEVIARVLAPMVEELTHLEKLEAEFDTAKTDLSKQMVALTATSTLAKSRWSAEETILTANASAVLVDYAAPTAERAAELQAELSAGMTTEVLPLLHLSTNELFGETRAECVENLEYEAPATVIAIVCDGADSLRAMKSVSEVYGILVELKSEGLMAISELLKDPNLDPADKADLEEFATRLAAIEVLKGAGITTVKIDLSDIFWPELKMGLTIGLSETGASAALDASMPVSEDFKTDLMDQANTYAAALEKQDEEAEELAADMVGLLVYIGYDFAVGYDEDEEEVVE